MNVGKNNMLKKVLLLFQPNTRGPIAFKLINDFRLVLKDAVQ